MIVNSAAIISIIILAAIDSISVMQIKKLLFKKTTTFEMLNKSSSLCYSMKFEFLTAVVHSEYKTYKLQTFAAQFSII